MIERPYRLIAYRPDGVEMSRGHRQSASDSAFVCTDYLNEKELKEKFVGLLRKNKNEDRPYAEQDYQIYIFKNGIKIYEDGSLYFDKRNYLTDDECETRWQELKTKEGETIEEIQRIVNAAEEIIKHGSEEAAKKAAEQKRREEEARIARAKEERRKQWMKLCDEFGNPGPLPE